MNSPDGLDLEVVGCTVGDKKTKAQLKDGAGGFVTALRLKNNALFFRFEAMACLMEFSTKKILDSVEWVFDVAFRGQFTLSNSALRVYQPMLLSDRLTSKNTGIREAANSRFVAPKQCLSFWNEELVAKNVKIGSEPVTWQEVPENPMTWAYEASNI